MSWSQTPASFHAASRRQQVMPEPNPSSYGRCSHWIPVCRTNTIPHKAVERTTNALKGFRAVATRFDRRAYLFHGTVTAAAIRLWLRS